MDKNSVLKIIGRFNKAIESKGVKITRVILFGSYATGIQKGTSDIDLVVISEDFKNKGYWKRLEILSDAIYEVHEPIEAVAMTPKEWARGDSLIVDFARHGKVVYE